MLIRDGISANDRYEAKDATLRQARHAVSLAGITGGFDRRSRQEAQLRDQINGWFADVANEFINVPKAVEYENVTWRDDGDGGTTATHKPVPQPDFILGAVSFDTNTGYSGTFFCHGWQLTRVHTATFRVRASSISESAVKRHVFFACYSDASALAGPTIAKTGTATGGLPIRI